MFSCIYCYLALFTLIWPYLITLIIPIANKAINHSNIYIFNYIKRKQFVQGFKKVSSEDNWTSSNPLNGFAHLPAEILMFDGRLSS